MAQEQKQEQPVYFETRSINRWVLGTIIAILTIVSLALATRWPLVIPFFAGIIALLLSTRVIFAVYSDGFYYQISPIERRPRRVPFEDIEGIKADRYSFLKYGFGLSLTSLGRRMIISGKGVVIVKLTGRKMLLLGTQSGEALVRAIQESWRQG